MSNSVKVLVGVLAAAAAGVAIGLLVAPDSGEETRRKVRGQANDLADELLNNIQERKAKLDALAEKATQKVNDLRGKAKSTIDSVADTVEEQLVVEKA